MANKPKKVGSGRCVGGHKTFHPGLITTRAESEGREPRAGEREEAAPGNPAVSGLFWLLQPSQPSEEVRLGEGAEAGPGGGLGADHGTQVKITATVSILGFSKL